MNITSSVDTRVFTENMRRLSKYTGIAMSELLPGEARLMAQEAAKITTPFGLNNKARDKGRGAVRKDLLGGRRGKPGIFFSLADGIQPLSKQSNGRVVMFAKANGEVFGVDAHNYRPNASVAEMEAYHRRHISRGFFHVRGGKPNRKQGRYIHVERMVVGGTSMRKYLAHAMDKVGWAKAAWAAVYQRLGGMRMPAWIRRHIGTTPNYVLDMSRLFSQSPEIVIGNRTSGISRNVPRRVLQMTMDRRGYAMQKRVLNIVRGQAFEIRKGVVRTFKPKT